MYPDDERPITSLSEFRETLVQELNLRAAKRAKEESELPQQNLNLPKVDLIVFKCTPKGLVKVSSGSS